MGMGIWEQKRLRKYRSNGIHSGTYVDRSRHLQAKLRIVLLFMFVGITFAFFALLVYYSLVNHVSIAHQFDNWMTWLWQQQPKAPEMNNKGQLK